MFFVVVPESVMDCPSMVREMVHDPGEPAVKHVQKAWNSNGPARSSGSRERVWVMGDPEPMRAAQSTGLVWDLLS